MKINPSRKLQTIRYQYRSSMMAKGVHVLGNVLFCCLTLENDTPGNCILVTGVAVVSFIIDFQL